ARGPETRTNTFTTGRQSQPVVAADAAGDFVVAWQSYGQDGSYEGVYAQHYSADGIPLGGEFRVNAYTTSNQWEPAVGMDAAGDFVIAWASFGQDGSDYGVFARRYSAAGAPLGGEFLVNSYTNSRQHLPSVAMDAAGDFVVAWTGYGRDGNGYGV